MDITANDHPTKVVITDEGAPYANDHPFKVEIEGGGDFATKEDIEELEEKIAALATDLSYKGGVPTYADLPSDPEQGDVYTTDDTGILWVWDGIKWVPLNDNQEAILGTDAPTTSTEGKVGQLYLNTMTGKVYILQTIDTSTTPATYTWIAVGPTVVQTTGTSTTDVMSQNAITGMVYADPNVLTHIRIGNGATSPSSTGTARTVAIGREAAATNSYAVAIGSQSTAAVESTAVGGELARATAVFSSAFGTRASASGENSVAVGYYAQATQKGQFDISTLGEGPTTTRGYNNSAYRLLTGLYDGQSAHDAATVGQIGSTISDQDFATLLNGTGA